MADFSYWGFEVVSVILLNGDSYPLPDTPFLLSQLLMALNLTPDHLIIEHNAAIFRGEEALDIQLKDGDKVELIHFMGGGESHLWIYTDL